MTGSEAVSTITKVDADALLVALVLAPETYSRNRFFGLFQNKDLMHARRRAQIVRSLVKELTEPWPHKSDRPHPKPLVEERIEKEGLLHLTYSVTDLRYRRSATLTLLEAAALNYALYQAGHGELREGDRQLVEQALSKLSP